jgi:hypothetical protein
MKEGKHPEKDMIVCIPLGYPILERLIPHENGRYCSRIHQI